MAITAQLKMATANFDNGTCVMRYSVDFIDDELGNVGSRGYGVDDPAVTANVLAFVQQMLPTIEAHVGVPVTLPQAAQPQPEPEPVP